jgi:molybdopterin converting factor small subunit
MRVTVDYFGPAREAAGVPVEVVTLDAPCTAADLVVRVARSRGGRLATLVLLGDRLAELLRDGDVVSIIPPVSGGCR